MRRLPDFPEVCVQGREHVQLGSELCLWVVEIVSAVLTRLAEQSL